MEAILDRHIECTDGVRGGRPRIAGTRITVGDIVLFHRRLGQSIEEIAGRFDLDLASVFAAMAFYYDHRTEVDAAIAADEAFAEAFRLRHPSVLHAKLNAMTIE